VGKKKEVVNYDDDLKDLKKILNNLSDSLSDEISVVNNVLDNLKNELNKAVRHNSSFTTKANELENKKQKAIYMDSYLGKSKYALEDEIARINSLRTQATSDRDYYYKKYLQKKDEERAAEDLLKKLL